MAPINDSIFMAVAEELSGAFTSDVRDNGERFYKIADDAPAWIKGDGKDDFGIMLDVHKAVDDRMPDDWIYSIAAHVADNLTEYDTETADDARDNLHEIADGLVDVYNPDRLRWLASHMNNAFLCDDAAEELGGGEEVDTFQRIGLGQYVAIERITSALIDAIEEEANAREEAAEEEDE